MATANCWNSVGALVLTLVGLVFGQSGSSPYFTPQTKQYRVRKGQEAVLFCSVHNQGIRDRVAWFRGKDNKLLSLDGYSLGSDNHVIVAMESNGRYNLHINNVTLQDAGEYHCVVTTDPLLTQTSTLKVKGIGKKSLSMPKSQKVKGKKNNKTASRRTLTENQGPPRRPPNPPLTSSQDLKHI